MSNPLCSHMCTLFNWSGGEEQQDRDLCGNPLTVPDYLSGWFVLAKRDTFRSGQGDGIAPRFPDFSLDSCLWGEGG